MRFRNVLVACALVAGSVIASPRVAPADGSRVALGGFCPVAYVAMGKAVYGDPKFSATYEGHTYHVANAKALEMFKADPAKYAGAIRYDAWCATALSMGTWSASDPEQYVIRDGKVYLFTNAEAKGMFEKDPAGTIEKADATWKKKMDEKAKMKAQAKKKM